MDFKDKIRSLRVDMGATLEQIGNEVGVSKATVKRWESGEIANIRRDKIYKLAQALHTTPAYLMGWDEESSSASQPIAISPGEDQLLSLYRNLNAEGQEKLLGYATDLAATGNYKKNNQLCLSERKTV